jgi:hypothetical protein
MNNEKIKDALLHFRLGIDAMIAAVEWTPSKELMAAIDPVAAQAGPVEIDEQAPPPVEKKTRKKKQEPVSEISVTEVAKEVAAPPAQVWENDVRARLVSFAEAVSKEEAYKVLALFNANACRI